MINVCNRTLFCHQDFYLYIVSETVGPQNGSSRRALCFTPVLFYYFVPLTRVSELRWPIAVKFCHMVESTFSFITLVKKIWDLSPKKFRGAKNVLNLVQFRTTSD